MGQSKQDGVKLSVEQPALIYIKASAFKNRNKILLPSLAFAVPPALFLRLVCPHSAFRSRGPAPSVGGAVQSRWLSGCPVFLCKMELLCRGIICFGLSSWVPCCAVLAAVVRPNRGVI